MLSVALTGLWHRLSLIHISIPILGTSVTEYGVALGLDNFSGTAGGNVSGTSDLAPLDQQADMIVEWMPEAVSYTHLDVYKRQIRRNAKNLTKS